MERAGTGGRLGARGEQLEARESRLADDGARLEGRSWVKLLARLGLCARGVIYVLLSCLAFDITVTGSAPAQTTGDGALQEVAKQPASPALLFGLSAGLGAYGLWRLVQFIAGQASPKERSGGFQRVGWLAIAVIYFGLCARALELVLGRSGGNVATDPRPWAARVLAWPAGPELLGLVGGCVVIGGCALAIWGFVRDYDKDLALSHLGPVVRMAIKAAGAFGDLARGFLVALVGAYLLNAAALSQPSRAKSVDSALISLLHTPYGTLLIALVATGFFCFALSSFAESRLRQL